MKRILLLSFIFGLYLIPILSQNKIALNQKQAAEIAEKFVLVNGYTQVPATRSTNLYLEEGEQASNLKNILATRLDSIESSPTIGVVKEVNGQSYWSIQFLLTKQPQERDYEMGRELRMNLDGTKIWINPKVIPVMEFRRFGDCTGENDKKPI